VLLRIFEPRLTGIRLSGPLPH